MKKVVLRRGTSFGTMMGCEGVRLSDLCFYLKFKFIVMPLKLRARGLCMMRYIFKDVSKV